MTAFQAAFHDTRLKRLGKVSEKLRRKGKLNILRPYSELEYWVELGWTYIEPVGFDSLSGLGAIHTRSRAVRLVWMP